MFPNHDNCMNFLLFGNGPNLICFKPVGSQLINEEKSFHSMPTIALIHKESFNHFKKRELLFI